MPSSLGQLKPVAVEIDHRPIEIARGLRNQEGFVFLDSACSEPPSDYSRGLSILASHPRCLIRGNDGKTILGNPPGLSGIKQLEEEFLLGKSLTVPTDCGFPTGGAIGWIDYDGSYCFGIYHNMLVYDHYSSRWFEIGDQRSKIDWSLLEASTPPGIEFTGSLSFSSSMTREDYCGRVAKAQQYISSGDIYQVNLSYEFASDWSWIHQEQKDAAFALYERLREMSPAPFAAYLDLNGRQILSSSPELFLRISGRNITTRPIKGTRPRFRDRSADERSAYELITSPKEISELVMITDLERNDLGKICETGSVDVSELVKLERFEQVFHLVSTVNGRLRPEVSPIQALFSSFPGGSITGAPKIRAMEIIEELELTPRGLYTGAIGVFGFNDESIFNIAIRTALIENNRLRFNTGAGIVADSIPVMEYEETLHKAAGFLHACNQQTTSR